MIRVLLTFWLLFWFYSTYGSESLYGIWHHCLVTPKGDKDTPNNPKPLFFFSRLILGRQFIRIHAMGGERERQERFKTVVWSNSIPKHWEHFSKLNQDSVQHTQTLNLGFCTELKEPFTLNKNTHLQSSI